MRGVLDAVQEAVGEVAGVVGEAVDGVGGMVGLGKREGACFCLSAEVQDELTFLVRLSASSPARFQVVVKRRADHSTLHQRRRRTVSVK